MNAPVIEARNAQRRLQLDLPSLQNFSERALRLCLQQRGNGVLAGLSRVDVLFVSDRRIAGLHRKFMNLRGPTDVITFQHGEIFISVETAKRNARRFKTSPENEIRLYLVHGLLHLVGFDDKTPAKARAMAAAQRQIFSEGSGERRVGR